MSTPLQSLTTGYVQTCKDGVVIPPTGKQINLFKANALNQSGSAIDVGICKKQALTNWKFYTLTAANSPNATDFTSAIQASGAVNIFTTTNNDGFMVGAKDRFNIIGLNISSAQTGSPVYEYTYFNGTSYVTLPTLAVPASYAVGTQLVVFAAPADWAVGTTGTVGGDPTYYYIRVRATTAGTAIVQANTAYVCTFLQYQSALANNGTLQFSVMDSVLPLTLQGTEQVLPYFATANNKNVMSVLYSTQ